MKKSSRLESSRLVPALVLTLALGILGATIFFGTDYLRRNVREQMVNHDGEILDAVAQAQTNFVTRLESPADQLALALNISQIKEGVLGVRLYGADGKFVTAFPPYVSDAALDSATLDALQQLKPVSRYQQTGRLANLFMAEMAGADTNETPLLEVNIPIHARGEKQLLAAAQLILDGRSLARDFAQVDDHLRRQAFAAFLVGGALLGVALVWAFRRLQKANVLLQERTHHLLHANHELALAAKTNAIGAVTAHLIHGLSNPLANLQSAIAGNAGDAVSDDNWQDARAATKHMQRLVRDAVRVLGEQGGAEHYELTLAELAEILDAKLRPAAQDSGVRCEMTLHAEGRLSNRHANLILLILENLVHNALQVTPRGQLVCVEFTTDGEGAVCEVSDQGTGFPPHLLKNLFAPCRSTKGGNGLGLAISKQLANQLGATLELSRSGAEGSAFKLKLPCALLHATADAGCCHAIGGQNVSQADEPHYQ